MNAIQTQPPATAVKVYTVIKKFSQKTVLNATDAILYQMNLANQPQMLFPPVHYITLPKNAYPHCMVKLSLEDAQLKSHVQEDLYAKSAQEMDVMYKKFMFQQKDSQDCGKIFH